jgi:hypothetical protein
LTVGCVTSTSNFTQPSRCFIPPVHRSLLDLHRVTCRQPGSDHHRLQPIQSQMFSLGPHAATSAQHCDRIGRCSLLQSPSALCKMQPQQAVFAGDGRLRRTLNHPQPVNTLPIGPERGMCGGGREPTTNNTLTCIADGQ